MHSERSTIDFDRSQIDSLLEDWRWLVQPNFTPILMTAFGDLFLRDVSGRIHFLDVMAGEFQLVADSEEEFNRLCENEEQREKWFCSGLLSEVRKLHGDLARGECFSCKVPLSLGGELTAANFDRLDCAVHYSVLGQIHEQTKYLPPGTKIGEIKMEESRQNPSWWKRVFGG